MADYINKNILCQAYIHIEQDHLSAESLEKYVKSIESFTGQRAAFFLYPDAELEVKSKAGTLTLYVTILGTVTALFKAVGGYPTFRKGAIEIAEDVKRFADSVISESLFGARAKHDRIIRLESRTGVIGSLRHIVSLFDSLKKENGIRSPEWMVKQLDRTLEITENLINNLRSEDDKSFVCSGLASMLEMIPTTPAATRRVKSISEATARDFKDARSELTSLLAQHNLKSGSPAHRRLQ
jgi:hypothetical protein